MDVIEEPPVVANPLQEGVDAQIEAEQQEQQHEQAEGEEHDPRMEITPQETSMALRIKAAIEGDPEVDNLSDFWYVQLALVHKEDVETAVEKSREMQYFRQEYDVRDDLEDAKKTLQEILDLFGDFILSFAYSALEQSYVVAIDVAKIDKKALQTEQAWRTNMAGYYYVKQACVPDFSSIRTGVVMMFECDGFDFYGKHGGLGIIKRMACELIGNHPVNHAAVKWFHNGVLVTLMASMVKPFWPKQMREQFQFGCKFGDRLDKFLLVPTPEVTKVRNYIRMVDSMKKRFENEAKFRLPQLEEEEN